MKLRTSPGVLALAALLVALSGCSREGDALLASPDDGSSPGGPVEPPPDPEQPPPAVLNELTATPATLSLGSVYVGQIRTFPVVVRNTSSGPVTIASVTSSRGSLSHGLALPATIPSGGSRWFSVTFRPTSAGALAGTVSLRNGSGAVLRDLPVTATAVALDDTNSVSVVDHGARGDGVNDDRGAFQSAASAAAASGKALVVPRPPGGEHYKLTGFVRIFGSVVGEPGAMPEIRMHGATGADTPGGPSPHTIFYYKGNTAGTVITGLRLNGGRDFSPGQNVYGMHEYSHGIVLLSVSNVWIENNIIEFTQGDSILIGGEPGTVACEDVRIVNNVLRNPMRCAVFPGDTRRLQVYLNRIGKVVEYQSAIDFEPNLNGQSSWDAEVAYNDFTTTLSYDHGVITSTIVTHIPSPGGRIRVHSNWGAGGPYSFYVNISSPASTWVGNSIQTALSSAP